MREQLGDHGSNAGEEMRSRRIFEPDRGGAFWHHLHGEIVWVHVGDRRRPHQIGSSLTQCLNIRVECARIGREILARRELRRVDEDRHHHSIRAPACQPHQGEMARVQRAHGRRQRNRLAPGAPARDGSA